MHVVEMRQAENPATITPHQPPSSCEWTASYVPFARAAHVDRNNAMSSGSFFQDGPMPIPFMNGGRPQRNTRETGHCHVATERIGDEIHRMPSSRRRVCVVLTERGAPGFENGSGAIIRMRI